MLDDGRPRAGDPGEAARTPASNWIWGAFKMPGRVLARACTTLWRERATARDEYFGTLVNAWLAEGGAARGRHAPASAYVDVGTLNGYRAAIGCSASERDRRHGAGARRARRARGRPSRLAQRTTAMSLPWSHARDARMDAGCGWPRPDEIRRRVAALGPWFHNIDLNGVKTAPEHFLGDYPSVKWRGFADAIPTRSHRQDACSISAAMAASTRSR